HVQPDGFGRERSARAHRPLPEVLRRPQRTSRVSAMDPALQEMLDEHALRKLVHAYCRAVDRGDIAALRDLYHHDAVDAHGAFSTGPVEWFFEQLVAARPYIRTMQHHSTTANFAIRGHEA